MAMFLEPEFWVAIAFLIFLGIVWRAGGFSAFTAGLDSRTKRIADELAEARRLRGEAQALLQEYQSKREEAEREADEIVASAKSEAERLAREAQERMAEFVRRRTAAAEAKIATAESQATDQVRSAAVEAAIQASERILRSEISGQAAEDLLTRSLSEMRSKLS